MNPVTDKIAVQVVDPDQIVALRGNGVREPLDIPSGPSVRFQPPVPQQIVHRDEPHRNMRPLFKRQFPGGVDDHPPESSRRNPLPVEFRKIERSHPDPRRTEPLRRPDDNHRSRPEP